MNSKLYNTFYTYLAKLIVRFLHLVSGAFFMLGRIIYRSSTDMMIRNNQLQDDDIIIVSYPRSGTTLTQMMLYQLSTDGNMDFTHITEYIPHFEVAVEYGRDLYQMPSPRILKTHLHYKQMPKAQCKYIYVLRNGKDVAVSYYHYYRSFGNYSGSFSEFFSRFLKGKLNYGSWFDHVNGWLLHKHKLNILFLSYEDLVNNLEGSIRKTADFCGFQLDARKLARVLNCCSFSFMKEHEKQFDNVMETAWYHLSKINDRQFIRKGEVGEWKHHMTHEEDELFEKTCSKKFGGSARLYSFTDL